MDITDKSDAHTLNMLSAVNATQQIFYSEQITETYVKRLYSLVQNHRMSKRREEHEINVSPTESFVFAFSRHPQIRFWQSYMKFRDGYKG